MTLSKTTVQLMEGAGFATRKGIVALLEKLDEVIDSGGVVFANLPTGYGKTILSVFLAAALNRLGAELGLMHVIHVLPMRSIVRNAYDRARKLANKVGLDLDDVAYQASVYLPGGVKEVLFNSRLVYTTLDSYALNYVKITPLRSRYATYEAARAAIFTSITVFDEAHLFTELGAAEPEHRMLMVMSYIVRSLVAKNLPVIIATATMPPSMIKSLANLMEISTDPRRCKIVTIDESKAPIPDISCDVVVLEPRDVEPLNVKPEFMSVDEALREACEEVRSDRKRRVMVIANTVSRAIRYYNLLSEICRDIKPVLLHGRLLQGDREKALSNAEEGPLLVATQVVEAGVDLDYDVLVTEPAPLAQLVQRIGRLCRDKARRDRKPCQPRLIVINMSSEEAATGVYDEKLTEHTFELLKKYENVGIEWRCPNSSQSNNYLAMLEEVYANWIPTMPVSDLENIERILRYVDTIVKLHRSEIQRLFDEVYNLTRETTLVTLVHLANAKQLEGLERRSLHECWEKVRDRIMDVSLDYLNRCIEWRGDKCVERVYQEILDIGEGVVNLLAIVYEKVSGDRVYGFKVLPIELHQLRGADNKLSCRAAQRLDRIAARKLREDESDEYRLIGVVGLLLKPDAYIEGMGLKTDVKAGLGEEHEHS